MRKEEIIAFLESGALESYLLGTCTSQESSEIEQLIQDQPEVREMYDELQSEIEAFANQFKQGAPVNCKDDILGQIDQFIVDSREHSSPEPMPAMQPKQNPRFGFSRIAAAAAIVILGGYAVYTTMQFNKLADQNTLLYEQQQELQDELKQLDAVNAESKNLTALVVTPSTQKVVLTQPIGEDELVVQAFWNNDEQVALLHASNLPTLPETQCYQLWADVDGEMISVAVLAESDVPVEANFLANATSINITVEPAGGNDHATVANLVVSAGLKS
ncbi:MAG: anti-sigma factor [Flavobacteriales bacterium]|nr:anti-sigma factor [Flavobacteriales bacterium]MDG1780773.1 anti-sigma factor [Flavobacteriales bacterium]